MNDDNERRDRPDEPQGPTIRDRRRIDPVTGEVRPSAFSAPGGPEVARPGAGGGPDASAGSQASGSDAEQVGLSAELAERTADLQRVQAEYLNYRRRVERDREVVRDQATAAAVTALFPVLDDIGRAREHGDLVGAFKSVSDAIEQALAKLGLVSFGEVGDPFDPVHHEALMHSYADDVTQPTCTQVFQPGYRLGDRVLRPARVAVAEPSEAPPPAPAGGQTGGQTDGQTDEDGRGDA